MRARSGWTAMVAGILMGTIGLGTSAGAQNADKPSAADSAPHFALFGGPPAISGGTRSGGFAIGASGDFRWNPIPVPLRFSVSFDERHDDYADTRRGGQASLDLVFRPIPKKFGIQPYFLGGAGLATQSPFTIYGGSYVQNQPDGTPVFYLSTYPRRRQTWAFASAGMGLDIGRAFIQLKIENPIASQGPLVTPLSVGFRFWD